MFEYLIIRDRRLAGNMPLVSGALLTCTVDGSTPLTNAFARVNASAVVAGGKLNTIFILCHGYAGTNNAAGVCMDAGGMGLQLGRDDVTHGNVAIWDAIKDKTDNIVVYACAAANTEGGNEGTTADGQYLMGALAIHTNSNVYGADRIQWYQTRNFDFGSWEGNLMHFPPSGSGGTIVSSPPIELSDVI